MPLAMTTCHAASLLGQRRILAAALLIAHSPLLSYAICPPLHTHDHSRSLSRPLQSTATLPSTFFSARHFSHSAAQHAVDAGGNPSDHGYIAWPTKPNPTPYDIFGMTSQTFDTSDLKRRFRIMAKQYHPDTAKQMDSDSDSARAAKKIIRDRFHRIVAAYQLLGDGASRKAYDVFGKGWNYANADPVPAPPRQPAAKPKYKPYRHDPFRKERMWTSGQFYYPNHSYEQTWPKDSDSSQSSSSSSSTSGSTTQKSAKIDHEKNVRTLMWIILGVTIFTFLQSLRIITWSAYDQGLPPSAFASSTPSHEVLTKFTGIDPDGANLPETLFPESTTAAAADGTAPRRSRKDRLTAATPKERRVLTRIRTTLESLHAQAAADGIDRESEGFTRLEERFLDKSRIAVMSERYPGAALRSLDRIENTLRNEYNALKGRMLVGPLVEDDPLSSTSEQAPSSSSTKSAVA
ncbi:hypothetical protein BZA70DRAFT_154531 [Myxozyma melibiosi]|uniref:J domain-containing protein n=1 Tax=Myxozyma melibiosi TaxID=54550 RepID=A0ABR1F8D0_9ASCO